jgi:conjugal transfer pilus assembly protein TraV
MKKFTLLLAISLLGGCSLVPYENEFSCNLQDNFGKCISVEDAYEEAVTGVEKYPHMTRASEQARQARTKRADKLTGSQRVREQPIGVSTSYGAPTSSPDADPSFAPPQSAYSGYRDQVYNQLGTMIQAPRTPMIKPPRSVRTMILPYSSELKRNRLYMPRFVYSIVEEPRFVMGQYLYKKPELTDSLIDQVQGSNQ